MQKTIIEDGSNDKRYFTLIPNYVLDHSTLWDREVYIQLKRIAGDDGTCWKGRKKLKEICGMSLGRLRKSLNYLRMNGWIDFIGTRKIYTKGGIQEVNEYKITDLWNLNNNYYQDKFKGGSPKNTPLKQRGVTKQVKGGSPDDYKEDHLKKNNIYIKKPFYFFNGSLHHMTKKTGKWQVILGHNQFSEFNDTEDKIIWK
jgi:hypothetical protein